MGKAIKCRNFLPHKGDGEAYDTIRVDSEYEGDIDPHIEFNIDDVKVLRSDLVKIVVGGKTLVPILDMPKLECKDSDIRGKRFTSVSQIDSERGREMVSARKDRKRHAWFKNNIVIVSWELLGEDYTSKAEFVRNMMDSWKNSWMERYGDMGYFPTEKTITDRWMKGFSQVKKGR